MPLAVAECTFLLAYELLNIMNHYTSVKFNENGRKWPERAAKCTVFALSGQL